MKKFKFPADWKIFQKKTTPLPEHIQKSLTFYHTEVDPKENNDLKPPSDENIKTHCVWVIEAYPPSYIDNLFAGLEKLNWTSSRRHEDEKRDHLKWIEEQRKKLLGGGWLNLGYLSNKKSSEIISPWVRTAPLPSGISYIRGSILQVIPSMTILILQFILEGEAKSYITRPLFKFHSTYI